MDRKEYCRLKFGSDAYAESIYENIARNAQQDGLLFHHDRITRTPNTRAAHRLTSFAQQQGEASVLVDELVNRLFVSYFVDGKNIGDHDVLTELAINAGLEKQAVVELLSSDTGTTEVIALEESAYDLGVMGVPGFVMDGVLILSGAQDPETIATRIAQTLERKSASMVSN